MNRNIVEIHLIPDTVQKNGGVISIEHIELIYEDGKSDYIDENFDYNEEDNSLVDYCEELAKRFGVDSSIVSVKW